MRIYNDLLGHSIETGDFFVFIPSTRERHTSILAKLGFNWFLHANQCKDCDAFINDFGSNTKNWKLENNKETYYIDLKNFDSTNFHSNKFRYESGDTGEYTTIKFILKK